MFNSDKSHIYFNEGRVASKSGAVVLYRCEEQVEYSQVKKFIAAFLMTAFLEVLTLQAGWVINASAEGSPVTSPVTSQESPSPSPSSSGAPITSPENSKPYVKITSPNGGEVYFVGYNTGTNMRITWDQSNAKQCIIKYSLSDGSFGSKFYPVAASAGFFNWTIDIDNLAPGNSARIKIYIECYDELSNGTSDYSDDFLTIINSTGEESASPSPSSPVTSPEQPASPSPSATTNPGNGGGGNGGSGGGSVSAPACNNEAPKSAPKIVSAITTGKNEVTLTWDKAKDPVTHYVIAYGLEKGKPLYGNPNVGNVASYAVKGLSGGVTYYFKVRAGNDCMPGAYSEEIGVKVGGKFIKGPAQNFKPGVLGKSTKNNQVASLAPSVAPMGNISNGGLFGKIFNFFKGLFN